MAKLPSNFLDSILNGAKERGLEAHLLSEDKGLLLFAKGIAASEQCRLLKNKTAELRTAKNAPAIADEQAQNSQAIQDQSTIDCQVTVEERAQLFKFLPD